MTVLTQQYLGKCKIIEDPGRHTLILKSELQGDFGLTRGFTKHEVESQDHQVLAAMIGAKEDKFAVTGCAVLVNELTKEKIDRLVLAEGVGGVLFWLKL